MRRSLRPIHVALVISLVLGTSTLSKPTGNGNYVLSGTIITPELVIPQGSVLIQGDRIVRVTAGVDTSSHAAVVSVDGLILPGMIDLHNHLTWNVLPRWRPGRFFRDRYEWQVLPEYAKALFTPETTLAKVALCDMERYAELKALLGGATAVTGSPRLHPGDPVDCLEGLARNLDSPAGLPRAGTLAYAIFPLELDFRDADTIRQRLGSKNGSTLIAHLAEGVDASAEREFRMFRAEGFLHFGSTIIHGVGLSGAELAEVAKDSVGLVWSPRSNVELYDTTANVAAAKTVGVTIAIAPDWSPTGSSGMLNELRYAAEWNRRQRPAVFTDSQLVQMATSIPARLAQVDTLIGRIQPHFYADLVVLRRKPGSPYGTVVGSAPTDVQLVIVGGEPLYGDSVLMSALLPWQHLEMDTVCGQRRAFNLSRQGNGNALAKTIGILKPRLDSLHSSLAPLQECS